MFCSVRPFFHVLFPGHMTTVLWTHPVVGSPNLGPTPDVDPLILDPLLHFKPPTFRMAYFYLLQSYKNTNFIASRWDRVIFFIKTIRICASGVHNISDDPRP